MKKQLLFYVFLVISSTTFAQNSGKGFSYQAVVRDADGQPKISSNIELQFSLLPGSQATTPSWQETQMATTDGSGVIALLVGKGIQSGGSANEFKEIDFSGADYWLKIELKEDGIWNQISFFQIPSVPYAEATSKSSGVPVGSIIPFAGPKENIPEGWLLCDGRRFSRTDYADLYKAIGTSWGHGNGSSTFHIPNLNGMFLRGVDYRGRYDQDRNERYAENVGGNTNVNVGSYQRENYKSHKHGGTISKAGEHSHKVRGKPNGGNSGPRAFNSSWGRNGDITVPSEEAGEHDHRLTIDNSGGKETRPDNAYVNYIIKY